MEENTNNSKRKIAIGLDLGVASCGWAIFDVTNPDKKELIDLGVRLFEEASDTDKQTNASIRRNKRTTRRRLRRIKFKKTSLIHLIAKTTNLVNGSCFEEKVEKVKEIICNGIVDQNCRQIQPLELRLKSLINNEQLTNEELIVVLYNYFSHRGFFYLEDESEEEINKKTTDTKETKNEEILSLIKDENSETINKEEFPSIKFYKTNKDKFNKFIGLPENRNIPHFQWKKEVLYLLNNQINIDSSFKEAYIKLFDSIRPFNIGPGSKNSPTPWGLYKTKGGEPIGDNLWDVTVGKCTIDPNENRGLKSAPFTEITNLLNDLINLRLISQETKPLFDSKTLKEFFNNLNNNFKENKQENKTTKSEIEKIIKKVFGFKEVIWDKPTSCLDKKEQDDTGYIWGFKTSHEKFDPTKEKKNEPKFTELTSINQIINLFLQNNIIQKDKIDLLDINFLTKINDFYCTLANYPNDIKARFEECKKQLQFLLNKENKSNFKLQSDEEILAILNKISKFTSTSFYGYKTMQKFITSVLDNLELKNTSEYFYDDLQKVRKSNDKLKGYYIKKDFLNKEFLSVNVKRTFIQAVNVINKIVHRYKKEYDLSDIVIEMAREKNSSEEKQIIKILNKQNEKFNNYLKDKLGQKATNGQTYLRLLLLEKQDGIDFYDGERIDENDLLLHPYKYEIDHIIPYSKCGIDSMDNKVLTKAVKNSEKGQRTPYEWLNPEGKYSEFEHRINEFFEKYRPKKVKNSRKTSNNSNENTNSKAFDVIKMSKNKYFYLTYKGHEWDEFIARNLNDTRYSTRLLLNTIQNWFLVNKENKDTGTFFKTAKAKVLNGSLTNYARKNLFLKKSSITGEFIPLIKSRILNNNHHAIDAAIICYLGTNAKLHNILQWTQLKERDFNNYFQDDENKDEYDINLRSQNYIKNKLDFDWTEKSKEVTDLAVKLNEITQNKNKDLFVKFSYPLIRKTNGMLFNETNYGLIKREENIKGKIQTIQNYTSTIDLLNNEGNFEAYFENKSNSSKTNGKDSDKLLINFLDNKKENDIYKKLCSIYYDSKYQYNKESKNAKNPFFNYLNELIKENENNNILDNKTLNIIKQKLAIPIWLTTDYSKKPTLIKKLRCIENFSNIKELGQGVVTSIKPFGFRIYKDINDKPVLINLTINNLKYKNNKFVFDESKFEDYLKINNIKLKEETKNKYISINNGTTFLLNQTFFQEKEKNIIFKNNLFKTLSQEEVSSNEYIRIRSIGSYSEENNNIELKVINFSKKWKLGNDKKPVRWFITFNDLKKYLDLCELDH
ncbi:MAG: type II CRISPR RNA-guided endonuclease Cas9, partial [Mycoplasmataceae bacterium]|nr:type II CRISPR RNA-guided endonuclease Cas9 [Mycoplasmataceae bacterium]